MAELVDAPDLKEKMVMSAQIEISDVEVG